MEDEKIESKEEAEKGDNKNEEQTNTKEPNDGTQKSESVLFSDLQLHEHCDDIVLIKTEMEKIEKIEIEKSDEKEKKTMKDKQTKRNQPRETKRQKQMRMQN